MTASMSLSGRVGVGLMVQCLRRLDSARTLTKRNIVLAVTLAATRPDYVVDAGFASKRVS